MGQFHVPLHLRRLPRPVQARLRRRVLAGSVHEFDTGPTFVALALTLIAIPSLMIVLSATLPARVNRTVNLVVAALYIPVIDLQRGGGVLELLLLLRPVHRARGAAPGLHPALRMDLAPHAITVDAGPRRSRSVAGPDGAVGAGLRSESTVPTQAVPDQSKGASGQGFVASGEVRWGAWALPFEILLAVGWWCSDLHGLGCCHCP